MAVDTHLGDDALLTPGEGHRDSTGKASRPSPVSSGRLLLAATCLLLVSTAAHPAATRDSCYAECSDGLSAENDRGPAAGETAPRFTAILFNPASGDAIERTLDALLDGRPLILAFGSYT